MPGWRPALGQATPRRGGAARLDRHPGGAVCTRNAVRHYRTQPGGGRRIMAWLVAMIDIGAAVVCVVIRW